ncbi:MAG: hypothetical protein ABSF23_15560 [Terracidiphilus sp.]|jgi:hypothetical protein
MRILAVAFTALALALCARPALAADPTIQIDFSNPGLSPSQWTLVLHADGSGHFRSQMGRVPDGGWQKIETPGLDRDIQMSRQYAVHVFDVAQRHKWFNEPCESHLKVAFEGWKTLTYSSPQGHGSCTFNYSRDREIEALGDSLVAVAQTVLEGARLETLLQHDRLGLDQETEFLTEAAENGRAQQICVIRDILERLAQDDTVLERVRKRARELLAHGST